MVNFNLAKDAIRVKYDDRLANYCHPFYCDNKDLDEFFSEDALLYDNELLGKTYA